MQWSYTEVTASLSPGLQAARFVYIKKGGSVLPLSPPYDCPFSVVEAGPKFFTVDIDSRRETVSINQLKPQTGTYLYSHTSRAPASGRPSSCGQGLSPGHTSSGSGPWGGVLWWPSLDEEKGRESVRFNGKLRD
jgi:hypothetical protein